MYPVHFPEVIKKAPVPFSAHPWKKVTAGCPTTFRTPISLVRISAEYADSPKRPKQEINIARKVKDVDSK